MRMVGQKGWSGPLRMREAVGAMRVLHHRRRRGAKTCSARTRTRVRGGPEGCAGQWPDRERSAVRDRDRWRKAAGRGVPRSGRARTRSRREDLDGDGARSLSSSTSATTGASLGGPDDGGAKTKARPGVLARCLGL